MKVRIPTVGRIPYEWNTDDHEAPFDEILKRNNKQAYHLKHLHKLMTVVYNSLNCQNPAFVWDLFISKAMTYDLKVNPHCTHHDASRYIAMWRIVPYAFLSVHTGEALPDIFSYNVVTITRYASGSRLRNSVNSRSIAKTNKKRWFYVHEV